MDVIVNIKVNTKRCCEIGCDVVCRNDRMTVHTTSILQTRKARQQQKTSTHTSSEVSHASSEIMLRTTFWCRLSMRDAE